MYPENLKYSKDHEWVLKTESNSSKVGVTSYAVEQLGDIVHLDLPEVGSEFDAGDAFGTIESTKTVSDLYVPFKSKVVQINEDLTSAPESLQDAKNGDCWLIEVEVMSEGDELMSAAQYQEYIAE